jgi:hypothetical protein
MELLQGFTELCDNEGGVDVAYLASYAICDTGVKNVATLTIEDGEVTAMTMVATKKFYPFLFEAETWSATDNKIGSKTNRSSGREQTVTGTLAGNTAEMNVLFEQVTKGRVIAIIKANSGKNMLFFHENGGWVKDDYSTGTSYEDMNGNTVTISGRQKNKAPFISDVILATLLA